MIRRRSEYGVVTIGVLGMCVVLSGVARAQDRAGAKRVEVQAFDQFAVMASVEEVFGGKYDLGGGIAELVRKRLVEMGVLSSAEDSTEGRVEGAIVYFGKESGRGEAAGVSVGGVRLGLGRRREVALVTLEARLLDVASGQMVTVATGNGTSDRGGWDLAARARGGADLGRIDLSGDQFKKSALGEATYKAVEELAGAIAGGLPRLGTFVVSAPAPVEPAPAVVAPSAPTMAVSGGAVGVGGAFMWAPYQFRGTEHFRYAAEQIEDGQKQSGFYQLDLQPAGQGRVRMAVSGQLGDESYSSTVTTGIGAEGMQMGMGQFMALGPLGMTLLNPTAWIMLSGHELAVGDGWSYSSGGESSSIRVESQCAEAGQSGVLIVFRENDAVRLESCVARDVALPLRMVLNDDATRMELRLTEYRP
ncbi:MAG TPA: CsgG/HfaB family protein [Gemmatimonadales bacterium]|jgi:hypothetical protein